MGTFSANERGRKTVLLLSGTSEGPVLARALADMGFLVRATVTRPEACQDLFGNVRENIEVSARGFTEESLTNYLSAGHADLIFDGTHPFAARITRIAYTVCNNLNVPYIRYERPDWTAPPETLVVDGFPQAAACVLELGKRVMLTIGSKQLKHFSNLHDRLIMFARILPSVPSIEQAGKEGFSGPKVLCLRPPFSVDFNQAMFREYQIQVLVTKASGLEGGVVEKVTAARMLGLDVVMVRRPVLEGVSSVSCIEDALNLARKHLD